CAKAQLCSTRSRARGVRPPCARDRDDGGGELEQPRKGNLGRCRAACRRDIDQDLVTTNAACAARSAERGMGDHGDLSLGGPFYKSSSEGGVIENAERDLNGRDVGELERLIQLATVDIGDSNVPYH